MSLTNSGPVCDRCGKYITGLDGGTMEVFSLPGVSPSLCFHESGPCGKDRERFKIDYLSRIVGGMIRLASQSGVSTAAIVDVMQGALIDCQVGIGRIYQQ